MSNRSLNQDSMNRDLLRYSFIGLIIVFVDQATKWLMINSGKSVVINRYLTLEVTYNRGISWGILSGSSMLFIVISLCIAILTIGLGRYAFIRYKKGYTIYPEVMVLAGSCSNLIDRVVHSGVVDFLLIHWNELSWPVFNFADVCIVVGIMGMFLQQVLPRR